MPIANSIANFGVRQGQNVERRIGNAMAYRSQQNAMAEQKQQQVKAEQMDFMKQGIASIASMPEEQRVQAWEGLRQGAAANFGQDHPLARNMPQYSPEVMAQSMARFGVPVNQSKNQTPASIQEIQYKLEGAGLKPGTPEYTKALMIDLKMQKGAGVESAPQIFDVGGVPHIFDKNTRKATPVQVEGQKVTPDTVANNAGQIEGAKTTSKLTVEGELRPQIAEDTAAATARGKASAEAVSQLPQTLATAEYSIDLLDKALNHPGLDVATGLSTKTDPRNKIPGTEAYDFNVLMDQIQGRTFLAAFESLKGGGQITEIEGMKAEQSIARLNKAQSKEAFVDALEELKGIISTGMDRARAKAGASTDVSTLSDDELLDF